MSFKLTINHKEVVKKKATIGAKLVNKKLFLKYKMGDEFLHRPLSLPQ
jgi:hypothetical protein